MRIARILRRRASCHQFVLLLRDFKDAHGEGLANRHIIGAIHLEGACLNTTENELVVLHSSVQPSAGGAESVVTG